MKKILGSIAAMKKACLGLTAAAPSPPIRPVLTLPVKRPADNQLCQLSTRWLVSLSSFLFYSPPPIFTPCFLFLVSQCIIGCPFHFSLHSTLSSAVQPELQGFWVVRGGGRQKSLCLAEVTWVRLCGAPGFFSYRALLALRALQITATVLFCFPRGLCLVGSPLTFLR